MRITRPLLLLALLALLTAVWAGWLRLGWVLPGTPALALAHGPLMIMGFLGALIPLERAVALQQRWMFIAPLLAGLGVPVLLVQPSAGRVLFVLSSLFTLGILGVMVKREPSLHTFTMALGALALVVGNGLWLAGQPLYRVVYAWIAFLVLTIGGERLELNRVRRPSPSQVRLFLAAVGLLLLGVGGVWVNPVLGARLLGLALVALGLWFLVTDIARPNLRHPNPLTRYMAICLFGGFLWLVIGGGLFLSLGALYAGPYYDAALHAILVGFVLVMIFGHAPVILPALLGRPVGYHPGYYVPLGLLHLSLVLRLAGDLALDHVLRRWGGLVNGLAVLLFFVLILRNLRHK